MSEKRPYVNQPVYTDYPLPLHAEPREASIDLSISPQLPQSRIPADLLSSHDDQLPRPHFAHNIARAIHRVSNMALINGTT